MSLVKTLGKIAIGVMVAKGVGKMARNRSGGAAGGGGGGLTDMLGSALGGAGGSGSSGGLGGLGGLLGGALGGAGGKSGGLGSVLGELMNGAGAGGQRGGSSSSGGLGELGALLGGRGGSGAAAGGLGGLLAGLTGGGSAQSGSTEAPTGGSFGDMLNSALRGEDVAEPGADDEAHAELLLTAMINAAKADGKIDADEERMILDHLGDDLTEADKQFVVAEMSKPLNVETFAASVPSGHEHEVYLMSIMGINLDSQQEARYLDQLRRGLNLDEATVNALHEKLGVPALYR